MLSFLILSHGFLYAKDIFSFYIDQNNLSFLLAFLIMRKASKLLKHENLIKKSSMIIDKQSLDMENLKSLNSYLILYEN